MSELSNNAKIHFDLLCIAVKRGIFIPLVLSKIIKEIIPISDEEIDHMIKMFEKDTEITPSQNRSIVRRLNNIKKSRS